MRKNPSTATELFKLTADKPAPKPLPARKLTLRFIGQERPQLDGAKFTCEDSSKPGHWQQKDSDGDHSFTWTKVPQAVSLIFLDYVNAGLQDAGGKFHFAGEKTGSLAASLGDAIAKGEGRLFKLFVQFPANGGEVSCVQHVFAGRNLDGKKPGERYLWIKKDYLPFECVEIFWDGQPVKTLPAVQKLASQIRKAEGLPPASKLKLPEAGESQPKEAVPPTEAAPEKAAQEKAAPEKTDEKAAAPEDKPPRTEPEEKSGPQKAEGKAGPAENKQPEPPPEPVPVSERFPQFDQHRGFLLTSLERGFTASAMSDFLKCEMHMEFEEQQLAEYLEGLLREIFPPGPIKPKLFEIAEPGRTWDDNTEILSLPHDCRNPTSPSDSWTIRDSFQGTLILGAPGSGKTTGSGRHTALQFLVEGYGGLVLTTKQSELSDWAKMIDLCKRDRDIAIVCPDGYLRLNMLQYEMERPTGGLKLTDNLVSFFKNLASVVGQKAAPQMNESFWENTGNEMLHNTIDCFMLAKHPVTLDKLCSFILEAPQDAAAADTEAWRREPVFGLCMSQAEDAVTSADDAAVLSTVKEYWLKSFPRLNPNTRSCIVTAFSAMVRSLRSRHINNLLSTMTTITPESCFNGRIIILALPTNDYHDGGLLVQAAWKYLFQRAVLSRADRNRGNRCRPVFLWEDEAQTFLIDQDAQFQPVARQYRVACVKLSQNISNLYARFGGGDAARTKVDAIIGSLNTRILHANGDRATNEWASHLIGTEYKTVVNTSTTPPVYNGMNPFNEFVHGLFAQPSVTTSKNQVREPSIHPHEFTTLQTGNAENQFVAEIVVSQVGRTFAASRLYSRSFLQLILLPQDENTRTA